MTGVRIAVLMTCHNRREATASCLAGLRHQTYANTGESLFLFIVDDGSTDGTADAIHRVWPGANLIQGTGSLFWAAGMALAERAAVRTEPDYLLWLNDDTALATDAIAVLLAQSDANPDAIIVGAVADPETGEATYGGQTRVDRHPQRFNRLPVSNCPQFADTFNGNVALIPRSARNKVGPIDGLFPHAYADYDYGLRAAALGVPVIQASGVVGECPRHDHRSRLVGGPIARWESLQAPDAVPWRGQARFLRRHGDWRWPALLIGGQIRRVVKGEF